MSHHADQELTDQLTELTSHCQYHDADDTGTLDKAVVSTCIGYTPSSVSWNYILLNDALRNKNSSGDEIANVNFYAVRPEATRIRWSKAK